MDGWIGTVDISILIVSSSSLKDRRMVVRSITDRAAGKFNLSAADLGPDRLHQRARLLFAGAASSRYELEDRLLKFRRFLDREESSGDFELLEFNREVFAHGDVIQD